MLIGIDASRATSGSPTGTENYCRELVRALVTIDKANRYRLYTRQKPDPGFFGSDARTQVKAMPFPRLWTHVRLSAEMAMYPPDVLFVPAHVLPPVRPARSVVTVHDLGHLRFPEAHPPLQRLYQRLTTQWNARVAWRVLVDSEATRDDLIQMCGTAPEKITIAYPALSPAWCDWQSSPAEIGRVRSKYQISTDYILSIGTVHPRKNYLRLVEAFCKIRTHDVLLLIAGRQSWRHEQVDDYVKEMGLNAQVRFLNYVPPAELPLLLAGARALAFPSLHEGFGLPILEAQVCRIPIVTSMTSSLPEVAGDGALFVDPCDVDAIGGALERVLDDEPLRQKLIENGVRNLGRFSWEATAAQVLRVLNS